MRKLIDEKFNHEKVDLLESLLMRKVEIMVPNRQTDRQTDGRTMLVVKSLLLKVKNIKDTKIKALIELKLMMKVGI